ncbi:MAG TPA: hypothetical protein K8V35_09580 [Aliicoccus persicus]|uniref:Family 2 glycosyl transferase n=1 Tax=Aliicoccus persicus TaxID=930138 RepID=A0A921JCL9_9STAP|nr:hypothetical protein [Aliicoccus persicus]
MNKMKFNFLIIVLGLVFITMTEQVNAEEFEYPARINGEHYEVLIDGEWESITIKGVNMGMAHPGTFPGEAGIPYESYSDWIEWIGDMNANVIRVYTLHPPGFYQALYEYNEANPDKPVYLIHGFWLDENIMHGRHDAYDEELIAEFEHDAITIMDAVHGDADIPETSGKADGVYTYDVSQYTIGWMFGTEWDPTFVIETNKAYEDKRSYDGTYYRVQDAPPFETWIAQQLDFITSYEYEEYGTIRPMSFTNWVTTDTLDHISDASGDDGDDAVSVNPNLIELKDKMVEVGQFASYHIYPYYPEFMNHEPDYINYIDHRGERNNYAGYLNALRKVVDMPVVVAEFGVPASRGLTHRNPFGWDQGFNSETEQGDIVTRLYEDIIEEDYLGGIIFTWQDEWFKRTWNTMDYDLPHRRPFWSNVQTNEQQFGILSFDRLKITLDGEEEAWDNAPLYEKDDGILKSVSIDHDEAYYYVRIDYDPAFNGQFKLPLDIIPNQGNTSIDEVDLSNGIEFYVDINDEQSRVWVDNYYDFYTIQYGHLLEMIDTNGSLEVDSGEFNHINFALNREVYLPHLDETLPFEFYETGQLKAGIADPEHEDYNALNDYNWNKEEGWIEIRLPWLLIGAKDPSLRIFNANIAEDGLEAETEIDGIRMGVLAIEDARVEDSFPSMEDEVLGSLEMYTWETWHEPEYAPRLKKSYDIIKELFDRY